MKINLCGKISESERRKNTWSIYIQRDLNEYYILEILIFKKLTCKKKPLLVIEKEIFEWTRSLFHFYISLSSDRPSDALISFRHSVYSFQLCIFFSLLLLLLLYSFQFQLSLHISQTLKRQSKKFYADAYLNGLSLSLSLSHSTDTFVLTLSEFRDENST